ncbi:MAG: RNA-directed DNA polymerase [Proteobacteria bacterium]|nr:MAG: RNA-directed DNA polymerase [Pseudomonadota bacterium]
MIRSLPNHLFSTDEVVRRLEESGIDLAYATAIRQYCSNLRSRDLPILLVHDWVSQLVGWDTKTIYAVSACQKAFYRHYHIGKNNGSIRHIYEPLPTLKSIQSILLRHVFEKLPIHKSSYAYRKGNTIRKNARIHLRQPQILKLDIRDFFGSIKQRYVSDILIDSGYTKEVSTLLARLCTIDGSLAQGAPTSPSISNAVMFPIDEELMTHFSALYHLGM